MATETYTRCDRCKSDPTRVRATQFSFTVGRQSDPAGGMEDKEMWADLCGPRSQFVMGYLVDSLPQEVLHAKLLKLDYFKKGF